MEKLRLWPGLIIVGLMCIFWYIVPLFYPEAIMLGVLAILAGVLGFLVWWSFFSRIPKPERWGGLAFMILALAGTWFMIDISIATANMGLMFPIFSLPVMCTVLTVWAAVARKFPVKARRISMVAAILVTSGFWIFLRTDGMSGDGNQDLNWRWAKTSEEKLLESQSQEATMSPGPGSVSSAAAEWPGFRGPERDGVVNALSIRTDWQKDPPKEMWHKPVGPGCSSFAVRGKMVYTQEQRGDFEAVSCYNLDNGELIWMHKDKARFYDSHAGAGPRSTPTISGNRIYTLGGTGILNALNALDGKLVWTRNAASDTKVKTLTWGFAGSPLVVGNMVIVSTAGKLAAYDTADGKPMWQGPDGGSSYSSPHLLTLCGVPQVLFMSAKGAISMDPSTGKLLWEYPWTAEDRILQPALTGKDELLLGSDYKGLRRVAISKDDEGFRVKEIWNSPDLEVYFNDHVIRNGYVYTYDGPSLACVDLKDGKRIWKGQRYRGWNLLLAEQGLLLILTEKGDLALVAADPSQFRELSRIPAIKGKTWNHPAVAGDVVLVRNAQEMAAFRLPR